MKSISVIRWLLVPLFLFVAFPVFAGPPQKIDSCPYYIDEPGKYRLTEDLMDCGGIGVAIMVSDVTLDLKGHTVSCADDGERSAGIVVGSYIFGVYEYVSNVKVTNGSVTGCADGVLLAGAVDSKVTKINAWGNHLWNGTSGTGITVWYSEHNVIMHNHAYDNEDVGIFSWIASGNLYKHNTATGNWMGIRTGYEDSAEVMCNRVHENGLGIVMGPASSSSLVRGNLVSYNWIDGISLVGVISLPEIPGDPLKIRDVSAGNTIRSNIVESNFGTADLFEGYWDFSGGGEAPVYALHPDGCLNTWQKNQYGSALAPSGCISAPVVLDDDDVCALDED